MIAFCGIICTDCRAFIATLEDDDAKRRETAEVWSKTVGEEIRPEEINCDGCLSIEGRHINHCFVCEIRKCGMEKEVENCAHCIKYPCEKLARFLEQSPKAKKRLEEIRQQLHK
jgi:hypothetical protein